MRASHEKPLCRCPQHCSPSLPLPRRAPCALRMSVTHIVPSATHAQYERGSYPVHQPPREASTQLPSALQPQCCLSPSAMHARHERDTPQVQQPHTRSQRPSALSAAAQCRYRRAKAMHAQQGRDSHQVREPHTRSWRLAVLSVAAQCCYRQVPCTLRMSVTHIQCTSLTREAITQLLSAPQPNAAIVSPSAMHAPHERDSHPVHQPHGEAGARLPSALQPNVAVAECHAPASYQKPAPSCSERWPKAAIAAPSAMHAQQGRDSHQVRESHTRSWRLAALSAAAQCCYRRVPCTPRMSMTHIKCQPHRRSQRPTALSIAAQCCSRCAKYDGRPA